MFGPAESVAVSVTPSADLAGNVAIGVATLADLAGGCQRTRPTLLEMLLSVWRARPLLGCWGDLAGVASSVDLAEVASSAVAEVASSAVAEVASSADLAGLASSADLAGFVTPSGTFRKECGDADLVPGDCDYVCDDIAEVASLAEHAGRVPVGTSPPADTDSTVAAGMSYEEQCQDRHWQGGQTGGPGRGGWCYRFGGVDWTWDVVAEVASECTGTGTTASSGARGDGDDVETPAIVGTGVHTSVGNQS